LFQFDNVTRYVIALLYVTNIFRYILCHSATTV